MAEETATSMSRPLRIPAVAKALDCSERTVRRLLGRWQRGEPGGLRGFKVGADWRVTPEALAEFRAGGGVAE